MPWGELGGEQGEPVCVAVSRVFGDKAAELPLVATCSHARRRGHARVMLTAFEDLLTLVSHMLPRCPCSSWSRLLLGAMSSCCD